MSEKPFIYLFISMNQEISQHVMQYNDLMSITYDWKRTKRGIKHFQVALLANIRNDISVLIFFILLCQIMSIIWAFNFPTKVQALRSLKGFHVK